MRTRKYLATSMFSLALLLACGIPGLAKNSRLVSIDHSALLNGKTLPVGQYQVTWENHSPEATVQFERKHQVVVMADARLEERDKKYPANMVVYDTAADGTMSVREIRFAGSKQVLVFSH